MQKKIKKEIVPIDSSTVTGDLFYGYNNKKEVIKELFQMESQLPDLDLLHKVYVFKTTKDGEDWFYFGEVCPTCGQKTKGVKSYFYGDY